MRKPFTKQERQMMIDVVNSGKSIRSHAPSLAKAMDRSVIAVSCKMYSLRRDLGLAPQRKKRAIKVRTVKQTTVVPAEKPEAKFLFNFNPTRTEVHQDHVRLYF